MSVIRSTDPNLPEPIYTRYLANQKVLLDVNTLLRGILFPSSHSRRLLDAINNADNALAIISPHIRNTAIGVLERRNPAVIGKFSSDLLFLIKNRVIDVVPDGDPIILPAGTSYEPEEDDIVMATALASNCTKLATMDFKLAKSAKEFINVIVPSDPERSVITQLVRPEEDGTISSGLDSLKIYLSPNQGSIILHLRPAPNSMNYIRRGGRRYLFCTDTGFACWLSEKTWKYQVGHRDSSEPFFVFPERGKEEVILLGISYDCTEKYICFGFGQGYTGNKEFDLREKSNLPFKNIINKEISLLSRQGGRDHFFGSWHGISTTANHVGLKGLQYALENYQHFLPHDIQRFPLEDALFKENIIVTP